MLEFARTGCRAADAWRPRNHSRPQATSSLGPLRRHLPRLRGRRAAGRLLGGRPAVQDAAKGASLSTRKPARTRRGRASAAASALPLGRDPGAASCPPAIHARSPLRVLRGLRLHQARHQQVKRLAHEPLARLGRRLAQRRDPRLVLRSGFRPRGVGSVSDRLPVSGLAVGPGVLGAASVMRRSMYSMQRVRTALAWQQSLRLKPCRALQPGKTAFTMRRSMHSMQSIHTARLAA